MFIYNYTLLAALFLNQKQKFRKSRSTSSSSSSSVGFTILECLARDCALKNFNIHIYIHK